MTDYNRLVTPSPLTSQLESQLSRILLSAAAPLPFLTDVRTAQMNDEVQDMVERTRVPLVAGAMVRRRYPQLPDFQQSRIQTFVHDHNPGIDQPIGVTAVGVQLEARGKNHRDNYITLTLDAASSAHIRAERRKIEQTIDAASRVMGVSAVKPWQSTAPAITVAFIGRAHQAELPVWEQATRSALAAAGRIEPAHFILQGLNINTSK